MSQDSHHNHQHKAASRDGGEVRPGRRKAADDHAGHDQHAGHSPEMFRDKFWLSLILTVPVVFWAAHIQKMLQNLWWAAGYNIFAIPLAAGALAAWGILLTPAVGAVLMSASTVVVAINAQLLKRVQL